MRPFKSKKSSAAGSTREKVFAIPGDKIERLVYGLGLCFMTDQIVVDGSRIGYMYREKPSNAEDSGWRFFSGEETQEYIADLSHTAIYDVNTAANYDPEIIPYLETPPPCAFAKRPNGSGYTRLEDPRLG